MIFVLDASAVLNEPNFTFDSETEYVTTPKIVKEFKSMESRLLVENALERSILRIRKPKEKFLKKVKETVKEHGYKISKADLSLIALGLELKEERKEFVVLTDDFSVQNFLELVKVPYLPIIQGKIGEIFSFSKKCPVCGKKFEQTKRKCPDCGVKLKSKTKKKKLEG